MSSLTTTLYPHQQRLSVSSYQASNHTFISPACLMVSCLPFRSKLSFLLVPLHASPLHDYKQSVLNTGRHCVYMAQRKTDLSPFAWLANHGNAPSPHTTSPPQAPNLYLDQKSYLFATTTDKGWGRWRVRTGRLTGKEKVTSPSEGKSYYLKH